MASRVVVRLGLWNPNEMLGGHRHDLWRASVSVTSPEGQVLAHMFSSSQKLEALTKAYEWAEACTITEWYPAWRQEQLELYAGWLRCNPSQEPHFMKLLDSVLDNKLTRRHWRTVTGERIRLFEEVKANKGSAHVEFDPKRTPPYQQPRKWSFWNWFR